MYDYRKVYEKMFDDPTYSVHGINTYRYYIAANCIKKRKDRIKSVIDISSGRGVFLQLLEQSFPQINVISTDIKKFHDCKIPFIELDLSSKSDIANFSSYRYDFLTCMDCLEHLEEYLLEDVLSFFNRICEYSFMTIANHEDCKDGINLHLTIKNHLFWTPLIMKYFVIEEFINKHDLLYSYMCRSIHE